MSKTFPLVFAHLMRLRNLDTFAMSLILSAHLSLMVVAGTLCVKMEMRQVARKRLKHSSQNDTYSFNIMEVHK